MLKKLILLQLFYYLLLTYLEVSRSTFDLSAYGVHIIIVHMLIPSTDVVAMLFMQLLNLLAIEKHRRSKISTNDVIKFLYDNLYKAIQDQNDMFLERTLSLLCSITLENEGAVELLSKKDSPFYLFGTIIDLINYDNIRIKTLAVTTAQNFIQPVKADISGKNLFVKSNHSLFCHRQGFDNVIRYINGVSESGGVFDEYVVASLRLMTAFTSPNGFGTEDTLKRIIVAAGALQPICQKFTMSDKIRDYSIILLYSLSSTLRKIIIFYSHLIFNTHLLFIF